ncbi:MAG: AraC family transcriptional regulator, partial [Solimonas sp.]
VSEVAFAFGFNDAAHFSRSFKARFGFSPRDSRPAVTQEPGPAAGGGR